MSNISQFWRKSEPEAASSPFASLQSLKMPFVTISANFRITGINEQAEQLLGYNSSELLSEGVETIFAGEELEVKTLIKELFKRGEPGVCPYFITMC